MNFKTLVFIIATIPLCLASSPNELERDENKQPKQGGLLQSLKEAGNFAMGIANDPVVRQWSFVLAPLVGVVLKEMLKNDEPAQQVVEWQYEETIEIWETR